MTLDPAALTRLREAMGLTKSEFASAVGVSVGTLADLESGRRNASPALLRRLADTFNVPLITLLA